MESWRKGTKASYNTYLIKWFRHCDVIKIDPLTPAVNQVLSFFSKLKTNGASYFQICAARSALSLLISPFAASVTWGSTPLVKRYMKGLFEMSPVVPKTYSVWDVSCVFAYMRSLPLPAAQPLKMLSQNLAFLLGLLSGGQRCQTIHQIEIGDIKVVGDELSIPIMGKIKQTRPGKQMAPLRFRPYREENLCIVTMLTVYLKVSATFRTHNKLFLSFCEPHSAVGKETISRWCKNVLKNAGVDLTSFSSHSSRSAATSKAFHNGIPLSKIMEFAGWSNERTFANFYKKDINVLPTFQELFM